MKEQRFLVLDIEDLRSIVSQALKEALEHFDGLDSQDEIMTKADIARYLGVSINNISTGAPQAYYVPFDKPMITTSDGKKGWSKSIVMQHLARRDKDIKKSYEDWLANNCKQNYEEMSDIYDAKADIWQNTYTTTISYRLIVAYHGAKNEINQESKC